MQVAYPRTGAPRVDAAPACCDEITMRFVACLLLLIAMPCCCRQAAARTAVQIRSRVCP